MEDDLRHHLTDLLSKLRSLVEMAGRQGVLGQVAARLRAAVQEVEDVLDPGAGRRRAEQERQSGQDDMDMIAQRERERGVWGIDEA